MCWAACDRLAKIALRIGLAERASHWRTRADAMHAAISARAWNAKRSSFAATFGGEDLDASLLLLHELDFLRADDPRFAGTVRAVEKRPAARRFRVPLQSRRRFRRSRECVRRVHLLYVDALAALGRGDEARSLFESLIARGNQHGLLSEHIEPKTGELWGNFPQTYSMVGLINSAMRLSVSWTRRSEPSVAEQDDVHSRRSVHAEHDGLIDIGGARRARDEVDRARHLPEGLAHQRESVFHMGTIRAAFTTTTCVSGSRLAVAGVSGPEVSTSVPVSAIAQRRR